MGTLITELGLAMLGSVILFTLCVCRATSQSDPPAPEVFLAEFLTDISPDPITIEVIRSLAPLGADRFHALIQDNFFTQAALFRVVPGFVLQFGISGNSSQNSKWLHSSIPDERVLGSNTLGTISFATAGPNTRSSQVFINYQDNSRLDELGFAPIGRVVSGLEVAAAAHNPTPGDMYEDRGNQWIREQYPGINFILAASVMDTQHF